MNAHGLEIHLNIFVILQIMNAHNLEIHLSIVAIVEMLNPSPSSTVLQHQRQ